MDSIKKLGFALVKLVLCGHIVMVIVPEPRICPLRMLQQKNRDKGAHFLEYKLLLLEACTIA